MHAFARPSHQLRLKVINALLMSLHYTSLYRRLILTNKERGVHTNTVGKAIHIHLLSNHWEGTTLLKFVNGQLYNGKLAKRYGHAPANESLLCHKSDSCTNIAGECLYHKEVTISRHDAACRFLHVAILKTAKHEAAFHIAPDLVLLTTDTGSHP